MALSVRHGSYLCGHCGTFHFPDTVDSEGIRVLGPSETPLPCPVCGPPLVRALLDEQQVEYCATCRGVLVPRQGFAEIVRRRRSWARTTGHPDSTGARRVPAAAGLSEVRGPADRGSLLRPGQHRDGSVHRL